MKFHKLNAYDTVIIVLMFQSLKKYKGFYFLGFDNAALELYKKFTIASNEKSFFNYLSDEQYKDWARLLSQGTFWEGTINHRTLKKVHRNAITQYWKLDD